MSTKRFTVVDTRTNRTKTFDSNANTVGELKADLMREGIDPTGMAIQEGLTKTELADDDNALLPHDVSYRGTVTNNLVFRLTQPEKRIKSGAMSRAEVYAQIKKLNLADTVHKKLGKNFTMCKTEDLVAIIEKATKKSANKASQPKKVKETVCPATTALATLTNVLVENEVISAQSADEIFEILGITNVTPVCYSASEIDRMFADM